MTPWQRAVLRGALAEAGALHWHQRTGVDATACLIVKAAWKRHPALLSSHSAPPRSPAAALAAAQAVYAQRGDPQPNWARFVCYGAG